MRRVVVMVALAGWAVASSAAAQDAGPTENAEPTEGRFVLVLESADPETTAPALRTALSDALGEPVVALGAAQPERILIVRVAGTGPAHVRVEGRGRAPMNQRIERTDQADWLVQGIREALGTLLVDWDGNPHRAGPQLLAEWDERSYAIIESGAGLDPPPR